MREETKMTLRFPWNARLARLLWTVLMVLLFATLLRAGDAPDLCAVPFAPEVAQVSPPGVNAPGDHEFDALGSRVTFANSSIFVQDLDASGRPSGTRTRVATGVVRTWPALGLPNLGNGAEWSYSSRGSELYYMRAYGTTRELWRAWEEAGVWRSAPLPGGRDRGMPWPSKDPGDAVPRLLYGVTPPTAQSVFPYDVAVREGEDPATERRVPAPVSAKVGGPRHVAGHRKVVLTVRDAAGLDQVALWDYDTDEVEQVSAFTAPVDLDETWTSSTADGGFVVWATVGERAFWTWERSGAGWEVTNVSDPSALLGRPDRPYATSPEPFTYGGQPYVVFLLSSRRAAEGAGPADVAVISPFATSPCHARVLTPRDGLSRIKPEFYELPDRMVSYYSVVAPNGARSVWVAETGLVAQ